MELSASTAFVSGANRGLGAAFVDVLAERGAKKIYAAARDPSSLPVRGESQILPIQIDVTDTALVSQVARDAGDTTLLINNAGAISHSQLIGSESLEGAREEMEVNYWGTLNMCRAFAPNLASSGGVIVNILSIGALAPFSYVGTYCAAKAAAWSASQGVRGELRERGVRVFAAFVGPLATDMALEDETEGRHDPKLVAGNILDAVAAGEENIFPDPTSAQIGEAYRADPFSLEALFAQMK